MADMTAGQIVAKMRQSGQSDAVSAYQAATGKSVYVAPHGSSHGAFEQPAAQTYGEVPPTQNINTSSSQIIPPASQSSGLQTTSSADLARQRTAAFLQLAHGDSGAKEKYDQLLAQERLTRDVEKGLAQGKIKGDVRVGFKEGRAYAYTPAQDEISGQQFLLMNPEERASYQAQKGFFPLMNITDKTSGQIVQEARNRGADVTQTRIVGKTDNFEYVLRNRQNAEQPTSTTDVMPTQTTGQTPSMFTGGTGTISEYKAPENSGLTGWLRNKELKASYTSETSNNFLSKELAGFTALGLGTLGGISAFGRMFFRPIETQNKIFYAATHLPEVRASMAQELFINPAGFLGSNVIAPAAIGGGTKLLFSGLSKVSSVKDASGFWASVKSVQAGDKTLVSLESSQREVALAKPLLLPQKTFTAITETKGSGFLKDSLGQSLSFSKTKTAAITRQAEPLIYLQSKKDTSFLRNIFESQPPKVSVGKTSQSASWIYRTATQSKESENFLTRQQTLTKTVGSKTARESFQSGLFKKTDEGFREVFGSSKATKTREGIIQDPEFLKTTARGKEISAVGLVQAKKTAEITSPLANTERTVTEEIFSGRGIYKTQNKIGTGATVKTPATIPSVFKKIFLVDRPTGTATTELNNLLLQTRKTSATAPMVIPKTPPTALKLGQEYINILSKRAGTTTGSVSLLSPKNSLMTSSMLSQSQSAKTSQSQELQTRTVTSLLSRTGSTSSLMPKTAVTNIVLPRTMSGTGQSLLSQQSTRLIPATTTTLIPKTTTLIPRITPTIVPPTIFVPFIFPKTQTSGESLFRSQSGSKKTVYVPSLAGILLGARSTNKGLGVGARAGFGIRPQIVGGKSKSKTISKGFFKSKKRKR